MRGQRAVVIIEAQGQRLSIPRGAGERLAIAGVDEGGRELVALRLHFSGGTHVAGRTLNGAIPHPDRRLCPGSCARLAKGRVNSRRGKAMSERRNGRSVDKGLSLGASTRAYEDGRHCKNIRGFIG